jgi:NADH-quinone oxidoreductase subunit L
MSQLAWLVPLFPLLGFAIIGLANRNLSKSLTSFIGSGSILASFVVSLLIFFEKVSQPTPSTVHLFDWITAGKFSAKFSFLIDPLSTIFLLVITGVGFLIHLYSSGYMHDDDGFRRFFAYLNLFVFFMLLLVLGDNFLVMFVGWEGVGLCSYLLIGYWFSNTDYNNAAKKAFIMNRIGDLGFLIGIFLIYQQLGSIDYQTVFNITSLSKISPSAITAITLCLFVGATGKSAQIPLFTWLPDAMAGPTPVSALIHAATMVTAGVYMIARSNMLFSLAPLTQDIILYVGLGTALLTASIGLFQNDIKKVLAYSTVSQLGLMFAALGVGAYSAGVFHVVTHAFFKALLFLGAGSVIHGMGGEQDIRKMGGLRQAMPITFWTFVIGTVAISGIPPFAGFFSKDQILAEILAHKGIGITAVAMIVSLMTCFYMFRLLFLTFFGDFRGTRQQKHHLHESPLSMTVPLMVLAFFSTVGGFIGFPHGIGHGLGIHHWLDGYLSQSVTIKPSHFSAGQEWTLIGVAVGLLAGIIFWAMKTYLTDGKIPVKDSEMEGFQKVVYDKYYVDETYNNLITKPLNHLSAGISNFVETKIIDGGVNGIGSITKWLSSGIRTIQTGNVDLYFFAMTISVMLILIIKLFDK